MPKTAAQMADILAAGGGLVTDARLHTTEQLLEMAGATQASGSTLILRNADSKTQDHLVQIAGAGRRRVIFEL
jgi:hypothetical protein